MSREIIQIEIDKKVFEQLQSLARPLIDTPSSIIKRLIENEQNKKQSKDEIAYTFFRGTKVPHGKLLGEYQPKGGGKKQFQARVTSKGVEFDGQIFDSPSAAATHAKKLAGTEGSAVRTNGWTFWKFYDELKDRWIFLNNFKNTKSPAFIDISKLTLEDLGL